MGKQLTDAEKVELLLEAVEKIATGAGAFDVDPLEHAKNVIDESKAIARGAIAKATEQPAAAKARQKIIKQRLDAVRDKVHAAKGDHDHG